MKYVLVTVLLLFSSCTVGDLAPDTMNIGAIRSDWTGDAYDPTRHVGHGEAEGLAYGITFGWRFGASQPRPEEDFTRERAMWIAVAKQFADSLPKAAAPPVVKIENKIETTTENKTEVAPEKKQGPLTKEEQDKIDHAHDALGILEWYGEATLLVQMLIASLILAVLITIVLLRKSLVSSLRYVAFWRAKEAPKNGHKPEEPESTNSS